MKPYINALLTRLGTVSALRTIDTNWGQLAYEQPPVQFPCALVDIQSTSVGYAKHNLTNVKATVSVTIANTRLTAVGRSVNGGLSFFDTLESVVNALDQWTDGRFDRLQLTGMTPTNTAPGFDAYILSFSTAFSLDTLPFEPLQPTTGDIEDPNLPPRWFREACFAWYSPSRQGLTNEQLEDEYPVFVNGLRDLSGHGNHVTLYGMDGEEDGGYIDANGNLVFDAVDDYGECVKLIDFGNEAALAVDYDDYGTHSMTNNAIFNAYKNNQNQITLRNNNLTNYFLDYSGVSNTSRLTWNADITRKQVFANFYAGEKVHIIVPSTTTLSSVSTALYSATEGCTLLIGAYRGNPKASSSHTLRHLLFFNRELTHSEFQWVLNNIFNS